MPGIRVGGIYTRLGSDVCNIADLIDHIKNRASYSHSTSPV